MTQLFYSAIKRAWICQVLVDVDDANRANRAGFTAAVSTAWGVASTNSDLFQLPRFTPWDRKPGRFALRLLLNRRNPRPVVV